MAIFMKEQGKEQRQKLVRKSPIWDPKLTKFRCTAPDLVKIAPKFKQELIEVRENEKSQKLCLNVSITSRLCCQHVYFCIEIAKIARKNRKQHFFEIFVRMQEIKRF